MAFLPTQHSPDPVDLGWFPGKPLATKLKAPKRQKGGEHNKVVVMVCVLG